jgi:branched-chain amino acid transport system ATP-binding protein
VVVLRPTTKKPIKMLKIQNLEAGYEELTVLKGVNVEVKAGEIVALIGPNGAGKSTVIKSIYDLANVTKGKIEFKGKDITGIKTHELLELGISFVTQGRVVFGELSVKENLEIGGDLVKDREIVEKKLEAVYDKFPVLKEKENTLAYTLSGGQRQQLALGRALMNDPSLLLLDEPSLGLSPKLQKELFKTIEDLKKEGISILIVEQNAKKAIEMADRTYLLENGNIALTGGKEIVKHKKIKSVYLGG